MDDSHRTKDELIKELRGLRQQLRVLQSRNQERQKEVLELQDANWRLQTIADGIGALRDSEERFRDLYDQAPVGYHEIDAQGRVIRINQRERDLLGYTLDEVIGRPIWEFGPDEEAARQAVLQKIAGNGVEGQPFERAVRRKDGTTLSVLLEDRFIRNAEGAVVGIRSTVQDISALKRTEQELRDAQARLQSIMDNINEHINIIAPDGTILWHNAAFRGQVPSVVGQKCWAVFEHREARCPHCVHPQILADGKPREYETRIPMGEENFGDWWVRATPLRDASGRIYAILEASMDVTERKREEEESRRIEKRMQEAQKLESLGVLAGGIAHDFNNLLMAILGNADLALMDLAPISPARHSLREIEAAAKRAADLARQMLVYSGRGKRAIEPIGLSEIVAEMGRLLGSSVSKSTSLRYSLGDRLPAIEGDPTQIRQIVMNLITNASEAIGDNGGLITVRTGVMDCDKDYLKAVYWHGELPAGFYVYLEVCDTGCGMDKTTLERIFDPFFTTKFAGRGLGLSAVQGIVRGHKGTLKVYSEPGKGTRFRILFPASGLAPAGPRDGNQPEHNWRGSGTILLVDDEESVLAVGKRMLERLGFSTLTAKDGSEAVELYETRCDDIVCVVLDLTMPRMDGDEALRRLLRIRKDARVIIASGYSETEIAEQFVGKGQAGVLQKPFQLSALAEKMREILDDPSETR